MGEVTNISWCDHTINWWIGCAKVSPACDGCYAEAMMDRRYHRVEWGAPGKGQGTRARTSKSTWNAPFKWNRKAESEGRRPFVFSSSLSDIFDNQVDPQWRADAFEVMRRTPNLVYLLLTKRPQNIVKLADAAGGLPENAALGTTSEDQKRAESNLAALRVAKIETKPLFTFGSLEPLLELIVAPRLLLPDWVITGGETDQGGHKARPTHPDCFRSLRDQCVAAGVPYHHKQNGEWVPLLANDGRWPTDAPGFCRVTTAGRRSDEGWPMQKVGRKFAGRQLDGVTHDAFPEVPAL